MPIFYAGQTGQEKVQSIFDFGTLDTLAYASGDILTSSAIAIPNASRFAGDTGTILNIDFVESTSGGTLQKPNLRLWLFGQNITPASRNSAQAFTKAQFDVCIGYFDIANGNWLNGGVGTAFIQATINLPYGLQPTSTSIYMVPEVRSAYTFHSTAKITGTAVIAID